MGWSVTRQGRGRWRREEVELLKSGLLTCISCVRRVTLPLWLWCFGCAAIPPVTLTLDLIDQSPGDRAKNEEGAAATLSAPTWVQLLDLIDRRMMIAFWWVSVSRGEQLGRSNFHHRKAGNRWRVPKRKLGRPVVCATIDWQMS